MNKKIGNQIFHFKSFVHSFCEVAINKQLPLFHGSLLEIGIQLDIHCLYFLCKILVSMHSKHTLWVIIQVRETQIGDFVYQFKTDFLFFFRIEVLLEEKLTLENNINEETKKSHSLEVEIQVSSLIFCFS